MTDQHKQTILIIEDEAPARIVLADSLASEGYEVLQSPDGQDGLSMALHSHPDLILTDLKMPNMGGLEMIKELRKDTWGKGVKVIILTNISDLSTLQEAMSEETFFYIIKGDSSMEKVLQSVKTALAK
jgi:CheY-like chemotaxis protein